MTEHIDDRFIGCGCIREPGNVPGRITGRQGNEYTVAWDDGLLTTVPRDALLANERAQRQKEIDAAERERLRRVAEIEARERGAAAKPDARKMIDQKAVRATAGSEELSEEDKRKILQRLGYGTKPEAKAVSVPTIPAPAPPKREEGCGGQFSQSAVNAHVRRLLGVKDPEPDNTPKSGDAFQDNVSRHVRAILKSK